jgi:2,4-dienoyl-CoA reductase-like NADH-dependent reductase (Old Yellow Enzyme family)
MSATGLFSPLTLRSVTFHNRIGVSPMCQYSSPDSKVTEWHIVHLGCRAVGGAGTVIVEATGVVPEGRISPADLGIWSDDHIEGLARLTRFMKDHGAVPGIQLAHAGRKASVPPPWDGRKFLLEKEGGWPVVGPSPIPFSEEFGTPREMNRDDIALVISSFGEAARRAKEAGFQVVEIHAAHGYLLHQFLSPHTNKRTDEYGGSFDNRTRLVKDVVRAIRGQWPDELPLFVRISATDWADGGWDIEQSVVLSRDLKSLGVDLIDCSSGGLLPGVRIPVGPAYQVPFSGRIRREAGIATAAVGMIRHAQEADGIVASGDADIVLLAREFLRNPYWPQYAAKKLGAAPLHPVQYARAAE